VCMEKYKNLGRLIIDESYYQPPAIDLALYDLANDPHEIEKGRLKEAHKRWDKEIDDMKVDWTSMFAYLILILSKESLEKVQGYADCAAANVTMVDNKEMPPDTYNIEGSLEEYFSCVVWA